MSPACLARGAVATSWVAPLAWHPETSQRGDHGHLAGDISPLLELDSDAASAALYGQSRSWRSRRSAGKKLVHINKCPVLAQAITLRRRMPTGWELTASTAG